MAAGKLYINLYSGTLQLCDCRILPKGICRNEVILALSDFSIPRQKILKLINIALNHTSSSRE